jgi:hypothetical protein
VSEIKPKSYIEIVEEIRKTFEKDMLGMPVNDSSVQQAQNIVDNIVQQSPIPAKATVSIESGTLTVEMIENAAKVALNNYGKMNPFIWGNWEIEPNLKGKDRLAYDFAKVTEKLGFLDEEERRKAGDDARNVCKRHWRRQQEKTKRPRWPGIKKKIPT